jgi:hypothetical protein
VRSARLSELLALEGCLVFRVLPQVAVRARLLDLFWKDEVDLVVETLDFGLQLLLEFVDHSGQRRS